MKIFGRVEIDAVTDVLCDVCGVSARLVDGNFQYGRLEAHWGYGASHDGSRYEVHLCESCFFATLAYLKQERRTSNLFGEDSQLSKDELGLLSQDDFFRDVH
ncbi:hypothetical protein SAMN05216185_101230 [Pseudomonas guariconensis]|uniref:hypothetical protein n=1 Tax=Pseudomonas guariconensis TaxID=1288410 RepID=UPI00088DB022|nr:hypothetical protein [Pseudomonas guariconensis]SDC03005.1 hypothetical protein SAMN05216185_101230 [Pseudomonas guariconensis]